MGPHMGQIGTDREPFPGPDPARTGGATGTTHGSPYTYDTAVPVIDIEVVT